jgi:hypothetical protein
LWAAEWNFNVHAFRNVFPAPVLAMANEVVSSSNSRPEFLNRGASTLVALCTVVGGFFAAGWWGAATILLGTSVVTGVALIRARRMHEDHPLKLQPRRQAPLAFPRSDETFHELAAAAACLILLERTQTGFWGYSYLYRLHVTGHTLPVAGGSLTGTPFAFTSLAHCTEKWDEETERCVSGAIHSTLAGIFRDGQYLRNQRPGQLGLTWDFEPPRHVAGALLSKILLGCASRADEKTIDYLTQITTHEMAWDLAISARSLITASMYPVFTRRARRSAAAYGEELLRRLIIRAGQSESPADIWANTYGYGTRDESQWATVWAVLPLLETAQLSPNIRTELQVSVEKLLWSTQHLDRSELQVFPRATRVWALKAISETGRSEYGLSIRDVQASLDEESRKFLEDRHSLLLSPIIGWEERDLGLEGFVGWAGICIAAGACGSRLSVRELRTARILAQQICESREGLSSDPGILHAQNLIAQSGLFSADYVGIVARAAVQVCLLKAAVERNALPLKA